MTSNMAAYSIGHLVTIPALLIMLWRWCALWAGETRGLIGVLLVCLYMPLMFQATYGIALYSIVEPLIVAVWCVAIFRERLPYAPLVALVVLGTLNRETALVLPLLFALVHPRRWKFAGVLFAVWGVVFVALRLAVGAGEAFASISQLWQWNTNEYLGLSVLHVGLLVPFGALVVLGARHVSPPLQRTLIAVAVYVGLVAVFGLWNEVRLFLPAMVISAPVAVRGIGDK